eukprot:TRINITY_DN0_c351_g1_i1.p1 TRINITY_DN0_c351_g1~~TRINITY_DN0_c351_g1_i1.p1  ORF type:complete len:119 (-),score=38.60 TRINITY_DN0_c351_g1_i1:56-412(-)
MALKSEKLFDAMAAFLPDKGDEIVKKVGSVFYFEISRAKGETPSVWTVDLKNGKGSIKKGKEGSADATFIMLDDDLISMAEGKLHPQQAFLEGKMRIKGNMGAAMKFTPDLLPKTPKL